MRLVSNKEMQAIDTWAQAKLGIPGIVLMENAARGSVEVLKNYFDLEGLNVLIVCGKGNNGGDGMAIARHLKNNGANVKTIILARYNELKGDALTNYQILKKSRIEVIEATTARKLIQIFNRERYDCIIDAIFGTGFKGRVEGIYCEAIELIDKSDAFVFSVDIPSGINGDTGRFENTSVVADATVTMCLPKRGNFLFPGRTFCGDLHIVDIGVPYSLINKGYPRVTEYNDIFGIIPPRKPDGNKGTFGQILIIAGARGFSGAAIMAARSCLRIGAGLVRLASPQGIMKDLESKLVEIVKVPLPQTPAETISLRAIDTILSLLSKTDVVAVGPGITTHKETAEFLIRLLKYIKVPLIIDADGLNILSKSSEIFSRLKVPFILTPHPGELSRLTGLSIEKINAERIDIARKYAKKFGGVLILKGAPTVIASPDGEVYVNPTGNSGLATAGSGDVLVGMIAGLLGQGVSAIKAAVAGVFLHGLCADLLTKDSNEYSLIASDLIKVIPRSLNYVLHKRYENIACDE